MAEDVDYPLAGQWIKPDGSPPAGTVTVTNVTDLDNPVVLTLTDQGMLDLTDETNTVTTSGIYLILEEFEGYDSRQYKIRVPGTSPSGVIALVEHAPDGDPQIYPSLSRLVLLDGLAVVGGDPAREIVIVSAAAVPGTGGSGPNRGIALVPADNPTSNGVTVTHGLTGTPTGADISITPLATLNDVPDIIAWYYVTGITATTFDIILIFGSSATPSDPVPFSWQAWEPA